MKARTAMLLAALAVAGCSNDIGGEAVGAPLAPPTGLQGVPSPDGTSVTLSWTDNATAESAYRVDTADVPILKTSDVDDVYYLPADATGTVVAVSPGETLYCRVLAITGTQQSKPSNMIQLHLPIIPNRVTFLSAAAVSASRIDLTWNDILNETGYRLERAETTGAWATLATLDAGTTAYSDTGLAAGAEYCYRLIAFNDYGESPPGNTACAATPGGGMTITTAAATGNVGTYASIAADAGGVVHVSHYDASFTNVLHTTNAGGSFATTTADAGPDPGFSEVGLDGTSIALDGSGAVHIAAHLYTDGDLRYVTDESGSFTATTLDAAGDAGSKARIRVSPLDGSIHIVYRADTVLKHAHRTAAGWTFEVFTPPDLTGETAFALDGAGACHVAFVRWVSSGGGFVPELVYAENTTGAWTLSVVPTAGDPEFVSIAVDAAATPHIVYNETTTQGLHYATRPGAAWTAEVIALTPGVWTGRYNAVAIDPGAHPGRLHVAYQDYTNRDLRYARKDPGGAWVRRLVDDSGLVGSYASIAVDDAGDVHIAYHDEGNLDLKVASGTP